MKSPVKVIQKVLNQMALLRASILREDVSNLTSFFNEIKGSQNSKDDRLAIQCSLLIICYLDISEELAKKVINFKTPPNFYDMVNAYKRNPSSMATVVSFLVSVSEGKMYSRNAISLIFSLSTPIQRAVLEAKSAAEIDFIATVISHIIDTFPMVEEEYLTALETAAEAKSYYVNIENQMK